MKFELAKSSYSSRSGKNLTKVEVEEQTHTDTALKLSLYIVFGSFWSKEPPWKP